jgi:hypothetical protein
MRAAQASTLSSLPTHLRPPSIGSLKPSPSCHHRRLKGTSPMCALRSKTHTTRRRQRSWRGRPIWEVCSKACTPKWRMRSRPPPPRSSSIAHRHQCYATRRLWSWDERSRCVPRAPTAHPLPTHCPPTAHARSASTRRRARGRLASAAWVCGAGALVRDNAGSFVLDAESLCCGCAVPIRNPPPPVPDHAETDDAAPDRGESETLSVCAPPAPVRSLPRRQISTALRGVRSVHSICGGPGAPMDDWLAAHGHSHAQVLDLP